MSVAVRAILQDTFGSADVLHLADIDKPRGGDRDVLVHVQAASVNPADWHFMRGEPYIARAAAFGIRRPKQRVRGTDLAGRVEAVGAAVQDLHPGDEVFGSCAGAFAEEACGDANNFAVKPANLTFEQAAAVPMGAVTALQLLRDIGKVQPGQRVLINGAAGGVGTFAVQIAKWLGADVTAVCSTRNVDMVRSLGADHVIDYTQQDFTHMGRRYDVILDNVGNHSLSACRRALTPDGTLIPNSGAGGRWIGAFRRVAAGSLVSRFTRQKIRLKVAAIHTDDLNVLRELIEAGTVRPVVDRTYPLADVPDAIRYLEEGHVPGKVVISL